MNASVPVERQAELDETARRVIDANLYLTLGTQDPDGSPRLSCLTLADACAGRSIETTAGLRRGPDLHPLQTAFMDRFAAQCGYCTPGMLMAAKALLDKNPNPTRENVVDAIGGNVCRCTGYEPIINAVLDAVRSDSRRRA